MAPSTPSLLPQLPPALLCGNAHYNRMQALHAEVQALARSSAPQGMSEYERAAIRRSAGARQARLGAPAPYRPLGGYGAAPALLGVVGDGRLRRSRAPRARGRRRAGARRRRRSPTPRAARRDELGVARLEGLGSSDDEAAASILLSLTPGNSPRPRRAAGSRSPSVRRCSTSAAASPRRRGRRPALSRNPSGLDGITWVGSRPSTASRRATRSSRRSMAHRSNSMEDLRFHR